jgi:hypothetical protein
MMMMQGPDGEPNNNKILHSAEIYRRYNVLPLSALSIGSRNMVAEAKTWTRCDLHSKQYDLSVSADTGTPSYFWFPTCLSENKR